MKNYILLYLLILLCNPVYSQKIAKSRQPVKKVSVQNVKSSDNQKEKKIGQVSQRKKTNRRGDYIKAKKSVDRRLEPAGAKRASNTR